MKGHFLSKTQSQYLRPHSLLEPNDPRMRPSELSLILPYHAIPPLDSSSILAARTDVVALNGGLGRTEAQTNVLVPSSATLARSGALRLGLGVLEDVRLLLESTLRLDGQLGRPI